jgi:hypothetical protein
MIQPPAVCFRGRKFEARFKWQREIKTAMFSMSLEIFDALPS